MRHEASDVALAIANAGDIVNCSIGIAGVVSPWCGREATYGAIRRRVAEYYLAIVFKLRECGFIAVVIAIRVRDGNFQNLPLLRSIGKRRVRLFNANVNVPADESQAAIAHHRARKQPRFAENLEAVANAEDQAATACKLLNGLHDR